MSEADAPAPGGEGLSVDEAVERLTPQTGEGHADPGDAEFEPDGDEPEDGLEDAIAPPHFWSAEDKAAFEALPRHLQETVLDYERNRDTAAARAIQAAAEARNRAEQAASEAEDVASRLDKLLPEAEAAFGQRWPGPVDWAVLADEVGAEQAMRLKLQHDTEAEALQRMHFAKQEAEARGFQTYVAAEFEKLKTVAPDLADPKTGAERRQDVVKFLTNNGVPADAIRQAGATEFALAYDAMRYRRAQSAYAQGERPTPRAGPGLPPAAGHAQGASHRRQASARARFSERPSVDNAIAAIMAKG